MTVAHLVFNDSFNSTVFFQYKKKHIAVQVKQNLAEHTSVHLP